jgi:hypothetical protein
MSEWTAWYEGFFRTIRNGEYLKGARWDGVEWIYLLQYWGNFGADIYVTVESDGYLFTVYS